MGLDEFFQESLVPWSYGIMEAQDEILDLKQGKVAGFQVGIQNLDQNGRFRLMPKEVVVIAGRSGTGKTALGLQLLTNISRQILDMDDGGLIAVFSAEMSSNRLALRVACGMEEVELWKLRTGQATPEQLDRVWNRLEQMKVLPFIVDQSPAPTLEHMQEQVSVYAEDRPIRAIMLDYAELAGEWAQKENLRLNKIMRGMAGLAKYFNATSVVLSQMNRSIDGRLDKKPKMSDLMYGGEREADRILAMVQDEDDRKKVWVYCLKNRDAPPFETVLLFDGQSMRFKSATLHREDLNE